MDRASLISRKHEVQRAIQRTQEELARVRTQAAQASGWFATRQNKARLRKLEGQLDRLMAEESTLRQAIDRSA